MVSEEGIIASKRPDSLRPEPFTQSCPELWRWGFQAEPWGLATASELQGSTSTPVGQEEAFLPQWPAGQSLEPKQMIQEP